MNAKRCYLIGMLSAIFATVSSADSLEEVTSEMKSLVEESIDRYNEQSARISEEKIPLVQKLGGLENDNIELRLELERVQAINLKGKKEIEDLTEELKELSSETDYASRLLEDYLSDFEQRISLAEYQKFKPEIDRLRVASEKEKDLATRFGLYLEAVDLGVGRTEESIGGYKFDGKAIDGGGAILDGDVFVLGPTSYFKSASSAAMGVLANHPGKIEPKIATLKSDYDGVLTSFFERGSGEIPLDVTRGKALSFETAVPTATEYIEQGGPVGYAILGLGSLALLLSLVKLADLKRFSVATPGDLKKLVDTAEKNGIEQAEKEAGKLKGVVGEMIQVGIRNIHSNAVLIEEMMLSVILKRRPAMERFLPFLAITAAASPLLGLLGTVFGIIETFALIQEFGTTDPKALSSGISEALVTTAMGLVVAIPTLVIHGLFSRIVRSRVGVMEQIAFDFVKVAAKEEEGDNAE